MAKLNDSYPRAWLFIFLGSLLEFIGLIGLDPRHSGWLITIAVLGGALAIYGISGLFEVHGRRKREKQEDLFHRISSRAPVVIAQLSVTVTTYGEGGYSKDELTDAADIFADFLRRQANERLKDQFGTLDVAVVSTRQGSIEIDLNVLWVTVTTVGAALGAYPKVRDGFQDLVSDLKKDWKQRYRPLLPKRFRSSELQVDKLRLMTNEEVAEQIAESGKLPGLDQSDA